jgi:chemotaxis protein MotB
LREGSRRWKVAKKEKGGDKKTDTNAWMVTFSDLVTLLLTFFVMLLTMSSMDQQKFKRGFKLFSGGIGPMGMGTKGPVIGKLMIIEPMDLQVKKYLNNENLPQNIEEEDDTEAVQTGIRKKGLTDDVRVNFVKKGLVLSFSEDILFKPGTADINPSSLPILKKISIIIKHTNFSVRVEGHTDNVPIHSPDYPSNWELSVARAVNTLNKIVAFGDIPPERFSAVGYADTKPLYPNNTPNRREKNRRVELVLYNP